MWTSHSDADKMTENSKKINKAMLIKLHVFLANKKSE